MTAAGVLLALRSTRQAYVPGFVGAAVLLAIADARVWRCPHCHKSLGRRYSLEACAHCHQSL